MWKKLQNNRKSVRKVIEKCWEMYYDKRRICVTVKVRNNYNSFIKMGGDMKTNEEIQKRMKLPEPDVMRYDNRFTTLYSIVENLASFIVWGLGSAMILSGTNMEFGMSHTSRC